MTHPAAHQTQYPVFDTGTREGYTVVDQADAAFECPVEADAVAAESCIPVSATVSTASLAAERSAPDAREPSAFKNPEAAKNVLATVIGVGTVVLFGLTLYANLALR